MKKIISLALCLVLGVFALTGCSDNSEPFAEKSYTPDTQVNAVNLDVEDREIEVSLSQDDQVHIDYSENSKEYYEISVSDGVLTMTSASDKEWTDYIGVKSSDEDRKISLQVPDALLETLTLSTTNEDISLPELAVTGSVSLSANGGDISFEALEVGSALTLSAKTGTFPVRLWEAMTTLPFRQKSKKAKATCRTRKTAAKKRSMYPSITATRTLRL